MKPEKLTSALAERQVLVTGGAGFLGSEVVRQLSSLGAAVTVLDNLSSGKASYVRGLPNVRLVKGDVCDRGTVGRVIAGHELVVHLAALPFIPDSYYSPEEFFRVNTMGTVIVASSAARSESISRVVHISTSEVYGTARYEPMDEAHPTTPHSTYAVSKLAADRAVYAMYKEQDLPVVIIRPFNIYGPNVTQPYIVPEIALQLLASKHAISLGNVSSSRDFTFVRDTARGIISALVADKVRGETINLGSGNAVTIRDLALLMAELLGRKVQITADPRRYRPYDVQRLVCNPRKAELLLRWRAITPLRAGLIGTIDWIRSNGVKFASPFRGWPASYYRNNHHLRKSRAGQVNQ